MKRMAIPLLALCGCLRELPLDAQGFDCSSDRDCAGLRCVAGRCQDLARPELRWAPPKLDQPEIIDVVNEGDIPPQLADGKDYIIRLPSSPWQSPINLSHGRNVVIIGGHLTVPTTTTGSRYRALTLTSLTGTAHVEGLVIQGREGIALQALVINAREAIVQVENVRVLDVHGLSPDKGWMATSWANVRELRIDRFSGTSSSGGLDLNLVTGAVTLSRVDLAGLPPSAADETKLLLFLKSGTSISLFDFFLWPDRSRTLADVVSPDCDGGLCPYTGEVQQGPPPQGSFAPDGGAGLGYVSPGYLPE